jgi:MFS family permease
VSGSSGLSHPRAIKRRNAQAECFLKGSNLHLVCERELGLKFISTQRLRQLPLWQPLFVKDFRLFYIGQSISFLGDQFYVIALPYLVLVLTGSPSALGAILVVSGITRAVFQLLGGALSDHFSPRLVLLTAIWMGCAVTGLTALLVALGFTRLWYLYALAATFGIIEALFYPAYMSATPLILSKEQLIAGNALLRSTIRLMGTIGPALAGFIILRAGYATAFALDAASFVAAAVLISFTKFALSTQAPEPNEPPRDSAPLTSQRLLTSIAEGLRYARRNKPLRILFLFMAVFEFAFGGFARVGLPSLATRLYGAELGPQFYGWMASALAAGLLCGMVMTGMLQATRWRHRMLTVMALAMGVALLLLALATQMVAICALLVVIGIGAGAVSILIQASVQMSTERRLLGRVMSLLMFGVLFSENLSYGLAGIIADFHLNLVFIGSGVIMLMAFVISIASRTLRDAE